MMEAETIYRSAFEITRTRHFVIASYGAGVRGEEQTFEVKSSCAWIPTLEVSFARRVKASQKCSSRQDC